MECVSWSNGGLQHGEEVLHEQNMVTVFSYEEKTGFQRGKLRLTNFRLFWHDPHDYRCVLEIHLNQIVSAELRSATASSFGSRVQSYARLALTLQRSSTSSNYVSQMPPQASKNAALVQFEFEYGGHNEFNSQLSRHLDAKSWTNSASATGSQQQQQAAGSSSSPHTIGIGGIQRKIQDRLDVQDQKINDSFKVYHLFFFFKINKKSFVFEKQKMHFINKNII